MNPSYEGHDPPRTLAERLLRLNDSLQTLGERLKASIARLVGDVVAETVRDSVRKLLGGKESLTEDPFGAPCRLRHPFRSRDSCEDRDDPWAEEDRRGSEDEGFYAADRNAPARRNDEPRRWNNALASALQTCLWFLKQQPRRRPVLTTACATLAAGVAGFVAGPVLAAGAGVLASAASLILTAEASKAAAELAAN